MSYVEQFSPNELEAMAPLHTMDVWEWANYTDLLEDNQHPSHPFFLKLHQTLVFYEKKKEDHRLLLICKYRGQRVSPTLTVEESETFNTFGVIYIPVVKPENFVDSSHPLWVYPQGAIRFYRLTISEEDLNKALFCPCDYPNFVKRHPYLILAYFKRLVNIARSHGWIK